MTAAGPRVISVLIPAVGGQGGGVLSEWIVEAAHVDDYPVQATSIPGVAQRTGATSYVIELCDRRRSELNSREPVFSLFPVPGAVDVLLAPEFLEVGRSVETGLPSPTRTAIIASTHRLYSILEKTTTTGSIYPHQDLEAMARACSRRFIGVDALALARRHHTEANAVLLGVLAASGELPMGRPAFEEAIRRKGVQVDANLQGFAVGSAYRAEPTAGGATVAATPLVTRPEFAAQCARYPEPLRPLIGEALHRLVDYQDGRYAERFLARLEPLRRADHEPFELTRLVARHLAVWMTYEDAIRVADLKTRASRLRRIREAAGAGGDLVVITEYLRPDLDEIYGILPDRLVRGLAGWIERRWPHGRPTLGQRVRTTTVAGFLRLWLLARLTPLRPVSHRARREHALMEEWLEGVARCAALDYGLGCGVARLARFVRGYGEVRRRLAATFTTVLRAAVGLAASDARQAAALVARCEAFMAEGPEGEAAAATEAQQALRQAAGADLTAT